MAAVAVESTAEAWPCALLGFDNDNGNEFLNHHLPDHKDDNAHVEQKNWKWPRQLLGYGRWEDPTLVEPINELCRQVWEPLMNFVLPGLKLAEKWRERCEPAQTAYQRLMKSRSCPASGAGNSGIGLRAWIRLR